MFFNFGDAFQQHFQDEGDAEQENVQIDNKQYYQILEVQQNASQEEITSAYQRLSKAYQQTENGDGDAEKLEKLEKAFETLKDPQKRKIYDEYGKDGASIGGQQNLLNMIFGGQAKKDENEKPKMQATKRALAISLQNIYNGSVLEIAHTRARCCEQCNGTGGKNIESCEQCKGQGQKVQMYQMGPGMFQKVQKACEKCQGMGEIIKQDDKCAACQGKKIVQKQKIIQVAIEKGVPNHHAIKIQDQGNQIPGALAGDLYFVTKQKQHDVFTRIGADLIMKKQITFTEALTGFSFIITHLDGLQYTISTQQGEVISDQIKKVVKGLGMPLFKNPSLHGNLVVCFTVIMPKRNDLTKKQIEGLVEVLEGKATERPQGEYEMFQDFDPDNVNTNEQGGKKPEDQYDEDAEQQKVACTTH